MNYPGEERKGGKIEGVSENLRKIAPDKETQYELSDKAHLYLKSGQFDDDMAELTPLERLNIWSRFMPFILARKTENKNEDSVNLNVNNSAVGILKSLINEKEQ